MGCEGLNTPHPYTHATTDYQGLNARHTCTHAIIGVQGLNAEFTCTHAIIGVPRAESRLHLYSHASMGPRQELVRSVDQVLQDAVGQVLLVQLVGHRQAGVCHHPAGQQGQCLCLQSLLQTGGSRYHSLNPTGSMLRTIGLACPIDQQHCQHVQSRLQNSTLSANKTMSGWHTVLCQPAGSLMLSGKHKQGHDHLLIKYERVKSSNLCFITAQTCAQAWTCPCCGKL